MPLDFDPQRLQTVHLVPLTAYHSDGSLNLQLQTEHASRMASAGISCMMPAAGTSEFHSLSADEIVEIIRATRDGAGSEVAIFAPVGLQVGHAIEVAQRALEAGADGIMFMPFAHPYLSDAGAMDYYQTVIDAAPCPTLVYKKAPLPSNELLLELAKNPNVVGVKYAWNQMHEFRTTVTRDTIGIEWLCGSAERFAPYYMLAGSNGYTTGAGNICPHLTLAMHAAFTAGEYDEGMAYQQKFIAIEDYRQRDGDSYNISMLKHGMKSLGQNWGSLRAPQRILTAAEEAEIDEMLKPILAAEEELAGELATAGLSAV